MYLIVHVHVHVHIFSSCKSSSSSFLPPSLLSLLSLLFITPLPSLSRGVLETLIKRHFPTPTTVGFDWNLFENDPTLPNSCRKRKRNNNRGAMFQDEEFSSDSDDSRYTSMLS